MKVSTETNNALAWAVSRAEASLGSVGKLALTTCVAVDLHLLPKLRYLGQSLEHISEVQILPIAFNICKFSW